MTHLAGTLGCKTVPICAAVSGESVYGFYPRSQIVQSNEPCSQCYWNSCRGYNVECDSNCRALQQIGLGQVMDSVEKLLKTKTKLGGENK